MTILQQITSPPQASAEVIANENFASLEAMAVYAVRQAVTTGLTWGYYGGRWGGFSVADGTLTLIDAAANYVVVAISTGVISTTAASTNWDNTTDYKRVYKITCAAGLVSAIEDHRAGPGGVHGGAGASAGGGGSAGKHMVPIVAGAMRPSVAGGCAALAGIASAANQPDIVTLDFDAATEEYAQFAIPMPKSWNEGTLTAQFVWSHAATTTNFAVVWALQAVAISDDDAIAVAFGTTQTVTETGGTTNDLYISAETGAITVAGTPAAGDVVMFRVYRKSADAADTLAIDARLHAVKVFMTTDAETDA